MRSLSPRLYMLAVSTKLIPTSSAEWIMRMDSSSGVGEPKFIVPRQSGDTLTPVRPNDRYSIQSSQCLLSAGQHPKEMLDSPHQALLILCQFGCAFRR